MISGVARVAKSINPKIRIVGVEPAKIPSMALAAGGDLSVHPAVTTIADGINVRFLMSLCDSVLIMLGRFARWESTL